MIEAWMNGFILAAGLILPLGVQNMFIFNQGANQPRLVQALPSVITAALCDTVLVILAVLGISVVVVNFAWLSRILMGFGAMFLFYMGWTLWRSHPSNGAAAGQAAYGIRKQVLFAASVSLLNPHAILDTVMVIGMNSLRYSGTDRTAFAAAVVTVSWLWFLGLCMAGSIMKKMNPSGGWIRWINKISALIIWGTACYLLLGLVRSL